MAAVRRVTIPIEGKEYWQDTGGTHSENEKECPFCFNDLPTLPFGTNKVLCKKGTHEFQIRRGLHLVK